MRTLRTLPTGTVTFLFSDIEGSTRLLHELGPERYAEALAGHRRVMRDAFAAHGGVEVDTQGDAFFAAFQRASDAVAAAVAAQGSLADGAIRVRMGIHTGEPTVAAQGYVGMDVHRGARIMSAGHGGQVLISQSTHELLDGDFELRDLGEHRLKDMTAPQRLWQVGDVTFPPLKTLHQTNLPVLATPLVGRERELAEVGTLRRQHRLLTLVGPGGTGKTRLALQLAADWLDDFPNGVWWVALAPIRDPDLVEGAIEQVLGAKDGLASHLREKRLLLLLDNFEQLAEAAPMLADLVVTARHVSVLVTSREPLRLSVEREYRVEPLEQSEAVTLFVERGRARGADVDPSPDVAEICRRLEGLPLAIELAVARLRVLPPAKLLERLNQRLPLLTGGDRDAPERQRTLRATIDWSYELLSMPEQLLFRRLAIFSGGWTLEAAEEVCDATLDTLESLVEKSLVRLADERFFMLETIREYAFERFEESGETDEIASRHADFFATLVETADPALRDGPDPNWLARLDLEHQNLRAALERAHGRSDVDAVVRLVLGTQYFWWLRGQLREARRWHDVVLEHSAERSAARGKALVGVSRFAFVLEEPERAEACAREAVALWRELGDVDWITRSLNELGNVLTEHGRFQEGLDAYHEALEIARAEEQLRWVIVLTANIAEALLGGGQFEEARVHCEQCLRDARALGYLSGTASALTGLGHAELRLGRDDAARAAFTEALSQAGEMGHRELAAQSFRGLSVLAGRRGNARDAALLGAIADNLEESIGGSSSLLVDLQAHVEAVARSDLGVEEFERVSRHARAMEFGAAVAYGVSSLD